MQRIVFVLVVAVTLSGLIAFIAGVTAHAGQEGAPVFVQKIPAGYRDWKLISVAHEEANLNSFAAVLGNDAAIKAYRDGTLFFPDGAIIVALHYRFVP